MKENPLIKQSASREIGTAHVHPTFLGRCKVGDRRIATAVAFAVLSTATVREEKVRLRVREGYVTLEGHLYSCQQKEFLEAIVQHVPGVKGITNLIKIGA
jgi:osmotically-inducible protein OsmY